MPLQNGLACVEGHDFSKRWIPFGCRFHTAATFNECVRWFGPLMTYHMYILLEVISFICCDDSCHCAISNAFVRSRSFSLVKVFHCVI